MEILARTSVKPYMDSDFGGPLLEGVTVLDRLREQDTDGHSFFVPVPRPQTLANELAAGNGFCHSCREYFPVIKTGGNIMSLRGQVLLLLSDAQVDLQLKPSLLPNRQRTSTFTDMYGSIRSPNVEIQTVELIENFFHFEYDASA